jgi:hypothetical protein
MRSSDFLFHHGQRGVDGYVMQQTRNGRPTEIRYVFEALVIVNTKP